MADRQARAGVALDDKYLRREGAVLLTGVQALVRLMLIQAERDRSEGLQTGGFVSGYRGSPLGTLDSAFGAARSATLERNIHVQPGINEELAATAVAGTQHIASTPSPNVEGVFALWYGKGPGLDRAADAIRHGNSAGSSPKGGVLLAIGDDHVAKSSTLVVNSEDICASLQIPLFYPADPGEVITLGLHGFALSRATGSWAALKIVADVADATATVAANDVKMSIAAPALDVPPGGLHIRWPDPPLEQEARLHRHRLPAVLAYARANALDSPLYRDGDCRIGLVAAGKSWNDLREALRILELDEAKLRRLGVALYKVALVWPLEPQGLAAFAEGLDTLVVIEEKGPLIENQIKSLLYVLAERPRLFGKRRADGTPLFAAHGDLTPEAIAAALAPLIDEVTGDPALRAAATSLAGQRVALDGLGTAPTSRRPHFCSGCPHNRSTTLPSGSRASAGIGCHGLAAMFMPDTSAWTQMGGEGIHWAGLSHFTDERHIFANLGDGTYFHSGVLAIRQAVAARLTITYKLLYNSAVAMTGGQKVDGDLPVETLLAQLSAEGVGRIILLSEDPSRYSADPAIRDLATIGHRDDLAAVQRELRDTSGVSVIVYEQMCATERRRQRKRGRLPDPPKRAFINELVCEGCGDCSRKSNCLSIEPVDTPLGIKRRVNQSSCNKDMSCVNGFCPSFVTVEGGKLRRTPTDSKMPAALPPPGRQKLQPQRILVAGIGGTGVVTIGALVAMAAHIGGRKAGVLDQVGMAQKGGAVTSHIHVSDDAIGALRIPAGMADLVLVCDQVVGNSGDVLGAVRPGQTRLVVNNDVAITGEFTRDRDAIAPATLLAARLRACAGDANMLALPFTKLSERLLGDAIGSNLMMVGAAWQMGWLDLDKADFEAAIALNGQAPELNRAAFAWGRQAALDAPAVLRSAGMEERVAENLDAFIARRAEFLTGYQNERWAERYRLAVAAIRRAEARTGSEEVTRAAAASLFKLMSYKDEYEVARLFTEGRFLAAINRQFEGDFKLHFHMAPPLLARRDPVTGHPRKRRFGPATMLLFRLLAKARGLRGSWADPFGYTAERRTERALIAEYEMLLGDLAHLLGPETVTDATAIAALPLDIRGFGHVKDAAVATYRTRLPAKLARLKTRHAATAIADKKQGNDAR